jgi:acetolactate decarboxylase
VYERFRRCSDESEFKSSAYGDFLAWLEGLLPSPNNFYAPCIEGRFLYVKARSVPKQDCYKPLVEVTKDQPVFELRDKDGNIISVISMNDPAVSNGVPISGGNIVVPHGGQ